MEEDESSAKKESIKELMEVPSIGELSARALFSRGCRSIEKLREAEQEGLSSIDHIGDERAEKIYNELQGEGEERENIKEEFECPNCSNLISLEEEECPECGENVETAGGVVLPDKGILEDPKKTLAEVEKDIWDDGEEPEPWFVKGSILESLGANQQALDAYDRVIELDPLYEHIWNAKASVCLKAGKVKEAGKAYKVALDAHESPMGGMDVPTVPSTEEKVSEKTLEKSEKSKEARGKISEARSSIEQLTEEDLDISNIRSKLDEATDERLDENFIEAKEKAQRVIEEVEEARNFTEVVGEAKKELKELKASEEVDSERYEKTLEEIESYAGSKDYGALVQRTQDLLKEMAGVEEKEKEEEKEKKEEGEEEKEGPLAEKIEEAKDALRENRDTALALNSLKNTIKDAIKKKEISEKEEAIEELEGVMESVSIISEVDSRLEDFKGRFKALKEVEEDEKEADVERRLELVERTKKDLKEAVRLSKEGNYKEVRRWVDNISYALEWEKKRLEKKKATKDAINKRLSEVEELSEILSDEVIDLIGIEESMSEAKRLGDKGMIEQGVEALEEYVINEDIIRKVSDTLKEVKSRKQELEEYQELFDALDIKDIESSIKKGKEYFKEGKYEDAVIEFEESLKKIEEGIEECTKRLDENISGVVQDIEEMIEFGGDKEIQVFSEEFMEDFESLKEKAESSPDEETLEKLESLKERGEQLLEFKPEISEVEKKVESLEDELDKAEWEEKLEEPKEKFEKGDHEGAMELCGTLKEELEDIKRELEKKEMTAQLDEVFDETKQKLVDLRGSGLGLGKLKEYLRKANQAKKQDDPEKAADLIKKAQEAGDELKEISNLAKEIEGQIDELDDEAMIDAGSYKEEVTRYRRATQLDLYELAKKLLSNLKEELEEEDFEREKVSEMDDPTGHLKEKIGNLKELHTLVEESGIKVKIGKQHLKEAVTKIKEKEYEAVIEVLSQGEEELLEKLENELRSEVKDLLGEKDEIGIGEWSDKWIEVFTKEIESRLDIGDHREALGIFGEISNFVSSMQEEDSEIEKHLYSIKKRMDYVEESGLDLEDEKGLFEEAQDSEDLERVDSLIGRIREDLTEKMDRKIEEGMSEAGKKLLSDEIDREQMAVLLDHLMKAEFGRKKENLEMMIFYWKLYVDDLENSGE